MRNSTIFLFITLFIFSCSDNQVSNDNLEIEGTAWSKDGYPFKDDGIGFGVNGKGTYSYTSTTGGFHSYDIVYTYNKPNIVIKFKDGSDFGSGKIEAGKIYINGGDVYTKYR